MKMKYTLLSTPALLMLAACTTQDHYLVASTGTVIGVELAQQTGTQSPQATLGYRRAELAIVPTNRPVCTTKEGEKVVCAGGNLNGAADTGDVIMELKYGGLFSSGSDSVIYQRLAVGSTAVGQPGAAVMFARSADGSIDKKTASTIVESSEAMRQLRARDKKTYEESQRKRIDALLPLVDSLADARAIALEKSPPASIDDADSVVSSMDPGNRRASDGAVAKTVIKARLQYIERNEEALKAWEAALKASQ